MLSNAIRGHMAELGIISAKGRNGTAELLKIIADEQDDRIPAAARSASMSLLANMRLSGQRSWRSRSVFTPGTARAKKAGGWRKSLVLARSSPPRWWPTLRPLAAARDGSDRVRPQPAFLPNQTREEFDRQTVIRGDGLDQRAKRLRE